MVDGVRQGPSPVRLAVACLLLGVALAGCQSGGEGDGGEASPSSTSTGPAPVKAAISWHVRAQEEGGNATPGTNDTAVEAGTVLAFDAAGSTGPIATYAWDFGDGAASANKRAEHAYSVAGNYTVTLTVSSLANATSTASARVQVVLTAGQFAFRQYANLTGDLPLMNPNSCTNQGIDCQDHVVTLAATDSDGAPVQGSRVRINVTGTSDLPGAALQVFWRAPDGTALAQTEAEGLEHRLDYAGPMAPGDYVVRVRLFTGAQATYTGTVEIDHTWT